MYVEPDLAGLSTREFVESVLGFRERGASHIIMDCSQWRKLDLAVLSALVRCADALSRRGATLEIVNLTQEMRAAIRELRLHNRLRLAD
jgi:anti-anti-sigma regulatory factor